VILHRVPRLPWRGARVGSAGDPIPADPTLSEREIGYLQDMDIGVGGLKRKQPFSALADMSVARAAAKFTASSKFTAS
jgi:hypothetical protein